MTVGLDDVDTVGQPVEQRAGEAFVAEDLGPILEGLVGGDDKAPAFVGAADDFEEEFSAGLREGVIAELIEHKQVAFVEPGHQALEQAFFPGLEQLGDEGRDREEAYALTLHTSGVSEGSGDVGLARAGIAEQQDVLVTVEVLAAHEFEDQGLVEAGLSGEVEGVQGLEDGERGRLDAALGGALFPVQEFALAQVKEELAVGLSWAISCCLPAGRCSCADRAGPLHADEEFLSVQGEGGRAKRLVGVEELGHHVPGAPA